MVPALLDESPRSNPCAARTIALQDDRNPVFAAPAAGSLPVSGSLPIAPTVGADPPRSEARLSGSRWVRFVDDNAARLHHPAHFGDRDLDIGERIAIDRDDI